MRNPVLLRAGMFALLAASMAGAASTAAYAGGSGEGAASTKPVPDIEKKVFTNEDLEAKYGTRAPAAEIKNAEAISAAAQTATVTAPARSRARRERLAPEKDPAWYAQQTVSLSEELARIDAEAQPLIQFRTPGRTPRAEAGLILSAPCEGVSTDNRIAQLMDRRREIEAQMDGLEDTARRNDMPAGIFEPATAIALAAQQQPALSPAREQATLAERLAQHSDELAETQAVVEGMREDTAARRMTLLMPNGRGGNLTTDLLDRLGAQSNALQGEISSLEDAAWRAGIPARDLP